MAVAVGPEAAIIIYIDPGMGTRSDLDSWGEARRRLWEKLRKSDRRVEMVAVAWNQVLLDRAGRRLQSWLARDMSEGEKEALMLLRPSPMPIGRPSNVMVASMLP